MISWKRNSIVNHPPTIFCNTSLYKSLRIKVFVYYMIVQFNFSFKMYCTHEPGTAWFEERRRKCDMLSVYSIYPCFSRNTNALLLFFFSKEGDITSDEECSAPPWSCVSA